MRSEDISTKMEVSDVPEFDYTLWAWLLLILPEVGIAAVVLLGMVFVCYRVTGPNAAQTSDMRAYFEVISWFALLSVVSYFGKSDYFVLFVLYYVPTSIVIMFVRLASLGYLCRVAYSIVFFIPIVRSKFQGIVVIGEKKKIN